MVTALFQRVTRVRALVADDDADSLELVAGALAELDVDVTCAASGGELLAKLVEEGPFDVVVTDVSMPWMSGLQVMHSVRTAGLPSPVVIMTALRDEKTAEQAKALDHASLIYKPFSRRDLYDALQLALGGRFEVQPLDGT